MFGKEALGEDILGLTIALRRGRRDSVGAVGFPVGIGVNGFGLAGELGRKVSAVIDHSDYNSVCININQTNFKKIGRTLRVGNTTVLYGYCDNGKTD